MTATQLPDVRRVIEVSDTSSLDLAPCCARNLSSTLTSFPETHPPQDNSSCKCHILDALLAEKYIATLSFRSIVFNNRLELI
ncbi:hypothetical protein C0J52_04381 [Blattella germanica]|nr:hypothetical protein C0J52_04381 [Blattella germanica]